MNPRLLSQETRAAFRAEHLAQQPSAAPLSAAAGAALASGVEHLLLLCVHAHVRFRGVAAVEQLRAAYGHPPTALVSLPCCHQFNPSNDIGRPPDEDFEDVAIFSKCRRVLVWRWERGPAPSIEPAAAKARVVKTGRRPEAPAETAPDFVAAH